MSEAPDFEVVVAGGGPVGATLALALARSGLCVLVADAAREGDNPSAHRAYAVAPAAFRAWEALGVRGLGADAQPITAMAVADGAAGSASAAWALKAAIRLSDRDLQDDGPLAWMVEGRRLRPALQAACSEAGVVWTPATRVTGLEVAADAVEVRLQHGRPIRAALVAGSEGRNSAVRAAAGLGDHGWSYRQEAVVAAVALDRPHAGVARQLFLPEGPLAVLPLTGDRASLVWSTSPPRARALAEAEPALFEAMLARALGDAVGPARLIGPRARFPLELRLAERMVAPRIALAGDAAHTIHPVAGQGLNLGLKDALALAETVADARAVGEDIGAPAVLERYARWRRADRIALAAATDAFVRLFSTEAAAARLARTAVLALAQASGPLRRAVLREAVGASGDPPRLLRAAQAQTLTAAAP